MITSYLWPNFHHPNDHETILTCFQTRYQKPKKTGQQKLELDKMDQKQFVTSLEAKKNLIQYAVA